MYKVTYKCAVCFDGQLCSCVEKAPCIYVDTPREITEVGRKVEDGIITVDFESRELREPTEAELLEAEELATCENCLKPITVSYTHCDACGRGWDNDGGPYEMTCG